MQGEMAVRSAGFRRRIYYRPAELLRDLASLTRQLRRLRKLPAEARIPASFRERLMLVVTGVNHCRYCAAFHGRLALRAGISREEARALLGGVVDDCPPEQLPALLYARTWAESNACPGPEAEESLRRIYGEEKAVAIEVVLRSIRVGNLLGNSWDHLLCRLSRGRVGCDPPPHPEHTAGGRGAY